MILVSAKSGQKSVLVTRMAHIRKKYDLEGFSSLFMTCAKKNHTFLFAEKCVPSF